MKPTTLRRIHLCAAIVWILLAVPTVLWWHDSVLWVAFASLYANSVTHLSAYQGARAEVATVEADTAEVTADEVTVNGR